MEIMGIAVIGVGVIGKRHIDEVRNNRTCRLLAVADPSAVAARYAESLGVTCYRQYAEMLDTEEPDAVIVCTPNAQHLEAGLACISRGIPVLIEKPIADTLDAALALAEAAASANVPLLVGHHRRHNPIVRKARELIQGGAIGRLVTANIMGLLLKPDSYFDVPWRREEGGGPIMINLIHEIDLLRFICGEVHTVQATSSNAARGLRVEDTAACTLKLSGGALASISISDAAASPWGWDTASGEDKEHFSYRPVPTHFFAGTEGACSLPDMTLWRYQGEKGRQAPISDSNVPISEENTYANQLSHFLRVARREVDPIVGAHDAARTLEVTLAVKASALDGRRIELRTGASDPPETGALVSTAISLQL